MCGVKGRFTAKLKELFAYDFPALNDELAPKLMTGCRYAHVDESTPTAPHRL
jgi:hypothetical protein